MKNLKTKKGFTIVELVIVIAVIAILAAVLIPTFGGVIEKANKSAVQQAAANALKEVYLLDMEDNDIDGYNGDTPIALPTGCTGYTVADGVITGLVYRDDAKNLTTTYSNGSWSDPQ